MEVEFYEKKMALKLEKNGPKKRNKNIIKQYQLCIQAYVYIIYKIHYPSLVITVEAIFSNKL